MSEGTITLPVGTARELAYSVPEEDTDGWTVVHNEQIDSRRWVSVHKLIIEKNDLLYLAYYEQGLTEMQETRPWEDETTVEFVRCERRTRTVEVVEYVLIPGSAIPGQPGYVVGTCGHRVAGSEWAAGLKTCERCPADEFTEDEQDGGDRG